MKRTIFGEKWPPPKKLGATAALPPLCHRPCHGSGVTTGGNRSTRRKPALLGRVKLDNTLHTCDQGKFKQITARSRNPTPVTVVRDLCTTTVVHQIRDQFCLYHPPQNLAQGILFQDAVP